MISVGAAADVLVDGFARLQAGERPVRLLRSGSVRFARWGPDGRRGTGFTEEFFAVEMRAAEALRQVRAAKPGPHHFITMIGGETADPAGVFGRAGYRLNSREALMALDLTAVAPMATDLPVTKMSAEDAERSHELQLAETSRARLTTPSHLVDPAVIVRQVSVDGAPACVGKAVVMGRRAFVADVGTLPSYRRRGLARALMVGLHAAARSAGAEIAVLSSSDIGRALYLDLGYTVLREITMWAPNVPAPAGLASPPPVSGA